MDSKKPWQSKTILLNAIGGLLVAVAVFYPGAESLKTFLDVHSAEVGMAWSILNIAIRAITKDKISLVD